MFELLESLPIKLLAACNTLNRKITLAGKDYIYPKHHTHRKPFFIQAKVFARGFTLIEVLVVISIVALLGIAVSPFSVRFVASNNLETTVDQVVGSIRKAQNYSMDGKSGPSWGVCINGNTLRMYGGTCTTPLVSDDFTIPTSINITGLTDVTFSKMRGEPSTPLTIVITSEISTKTISLNSAGGLDVN